LSTPVTLRRILFVAVPIIIAYYAFLVAWTLIFEFARIRKRWAVPSGVVRKT
jgi:hypothetical protein